MRAHGSSKRCGASPLRRGAAVAAALLVLCWVCVPAMALSIPARALMSIPVTASDGTPMGTIDVQVSPDGKGVIGGFTSSVGDPPSLAAAAAANGEDHFNWFQVVVRDNMPPNDANGNPLVPPYVDPPPGGYQGQWADNLPWYWDEGPPPKPGEPGFENYDPAYDLSSNLVDTNDDGVADKLNFEDFPWGPEGTSLEFNTWLVSLNADGSLHSWHGGFAWTWDRPASGGGGGGGGGRNIFPTPDGGQITVISGPLAPIPEPSSLVLAVAGGLCLALSLAIRRRKRSMA